ncbi:MAG: DUF3662 domain-containing protein [Chloroflexi bacterium]|nr:DUF3662 domain-containing protein [Chloroflexota bacterium]
MPGLLGRIEGMLERAVEGGSRAIFRQRLQPIELAKACARAMERGQWVGPDGIEAPNQFTILLNPADADEIRPYQTTLEARIKRYLREFADERSLVPLAAIAVRVEGDPRVRRRGLRVIAAMSDTSPPAGSTLPDAPPTRPVQPIAPTAHLPRAQRSEASPGAPAGPLLLLLEDGRNVRLVGNVVRIGRAPDNDLVLSDSRVSRYHAQIVMDQLGPHIRDLGSTNGTLLAGRPVVHDRIAAGCQLSLGGFGVQVLADVGTTDR